MSRKTTAALIAALGLNFAMAGGALMLANLNKPAEYEGDSSLGDAYSDIKAVAGVAVASDQGDLAVPLLAAQQGGNTRVTFTCGKAIGGGREVHEGTWEQIAGAVLYRPKSQQLLAIEAVFDTRSLRTDAHGLTTTVTTKEKWFDIDKHPTAKFTCDTIKPIDAATPSHSHDLVGTFTLNGITKDLTLPAKLDFAGQSVTLESTFTILRSDYDVKKRESSLAGTAGGVVSKVEDEVVLTVRVNASPDPTAVISDLAQIVADQQEQLRIAGVKIDRLGSLFRRLEVLEQETERLAAAGPVQIETGDLGSLPKAFADYSTGYTGKVSFEMVLVPGDSAKGISPFYMSSHEVTWGMMDKWMMAGDLDGQPAQYVAELIEADLRPTPLYGDPSVLIQYDDKDNPAMAMSQVTARGYCKWLSEKTGRRYRLPTIDEWKHALNLGGGVPADMDAYAWHAGNSPKEFVSLVQKTSAVKTKKPNKLGIYDMLGGVAEWVTGTGTERVVVGGSIFTKPQDFSADWQKVEDIQVWSESYPNDPKSRFWYSDFYVTGIRLICEPASVEANPPNEGE